MYVFSLSDIFLYLSSELYLFTYILALITYTVCFSGLNTFSYPTLLNSSMSFTCFSIVLILLTFVSKDISAFTTNNASIFSIFFKFILLTSAVLVHLICRQTLSQYSIFKYEYDIILLFSILGLLLLNESNDLLLFYLAVELQSLSFYVLATFNRNSEYNAEAGLKYFILGALSSGLLLLGFTLIYISFGTIFFDDFLKINDFNDSLDSWAIFFIFIALLFKIGAFPFHQWLCDVYEGVLVTITAFFSIVPKSILFALLLRLSFAFFNSFLDQTGSLILCSGLASVAFASVAALYQKRLKRLLAYSAISHSGFILLAISCNSLESIKATLIYIIIYLIMSLALFSVIFVVLKSNNLPKFLINWSFFATQNLCLGLSFSCLIFSIAGIPPLAGFFSKLGIFSCLLFNGYIVTPVLIAIFSSSACFYYIRLIRIFFFVENTRSTFWTGSSTGFVNLTISCFTMFTVFCLARPTALVALSTFVWLSLF